MGGYKSRLRHHLKDNKKPHWHIDYLLQKASIRDVILCESEEKAECTIAQTLSHRFDSIPGFGSSDCKCSSHLFFATKEKQMISRVMSNINRLGIKPRLAHDLNWEAVHIEA